MAPDSEKEKLGKFVWVIYRPDEDGGPKSTLVPSFEEPKTFEHKYLAREESNRGDVIIQVALRGDGKVLGMNGFKDAAQAMFCCDEFMPAWTERFLDVRP
jgi:hypothetical protein